MRVGFILSQSVMGWLGGYNYIRNLLWALYEYKERAIEPVIFVEEKTDLSSNDLPPFEIIKTSLIRKKSFIWFVRVVVRRLLGHDYFLDKFLQVNNIDVLSHVNHLGKQSTTHAIGWIPDFQHKHLPSLFTDSEIKSRDSRFLSICQYSTCVIVSSQDAKSDLCKYYPDYCDKAEILRFVSGIPNDENLVSLDALQKKYHFKAPYFYMPNQFWAHKNHRLVVNALANLKNEGIEITVIASGNTRDYRQPEYYQDLMKFVKACGVEREFKVVGVVKYYEVIALMRYCVSLINPSLFEGWSTSVEEAKSLGKKIILSDIPVHREQAPHGGIFVDPHDEKGLAKVMKRILGQYETYTKHEDPEWVTEDYYSRRHEFAKRYEDIVYKYISGR